ncbi:MAG: glycoside hydrolase family 9 protein [Halanaerobiales bacterium]
MIHINQLGYKINDKKEVFVNSPYCRVDSFKVIDVKSGTSVYEGQLKGPFLDKDTGDTLYKGEFTDLKVPGEYFVEIAVGKSYKFKINENVYDKVKDALLKVMYFQRCGIELKEEYAGPWKHGCCHTEDAYLYEEEGRKIETTGGWHDAGDYGKYVVPAAKTVADLLLAYQFVPDAFDDDLNIPESGNRVPDILDEARVALDWMFKMQAEDGGVYHKVTTKNFIGMDMPETSKEKRYVFPISVTATADFAAVMAMASRVFKPYDEEFCQKAISAAEKAWIWLINNPDREGFKNPPGVNTGEYGDVYDRDERFWAAVELYSATGKEEYHNYIKENYQEDFSKTALNWQNVGGYSVISYLFTEKEGLDNEVYNYLKAAFLSDAMQMAERGKNNGYGISLANYIWGSNGVLMDQSIVLIIASILDKDKADEYLTIAKNNFNYLLGCNALSQSYITGFGSQPIMHPHHRPSEADGIEEPVPGMLSGGPNQNLQDETLKRVVTEDVTPARAFVDLLGSHSSNEITTYWNSAAVFVAGYFSIV